MIVKLENINKVYGESGTETSVPALNNVSLSVDEGEYVAIMGPSGSGKSTLMNVIGCLDKPTSGVYYFGEKDVLKMKDRQLSDLRLNSIGFVFQSFYLMNEENAIENVALPLSYAGVSKRERERRAVEALTRVGLADRVKFRPDQLSGGQKQRVAIARAIVNNPKVLLADEPTGALDQKSGAAIMELFQKLNDEGTTIIMITHDANIASHAKKTYRIVDGQLFHGLEEDTHEENN
ncbi:putative ABC transport system ATP-binding protein [Pseudobutyrivibrio sp. 49]|uniref:ABC transporter ATP-binding protein n=1 Tax=unclassified Pseudobutyrivibrio TaxID=2638619 RepID=UPI00088F29E7|nr:MULTISPECIES: ABC transporter ATP-binding protein [unclassified Pseudobutyrivibrio]SDH33658.1 putative ABC transport system ATP-binding protein [Pseudobutyrivibrio sp. 49]SFN48702.1 putative ABC transport system ATP-binding protein [Pseudobutyrivibrio sp. UC1225]